MSFKFIDLFAGIGGFHLALKELGGSCVFTSEHCKYAQKVYEDNFGITPHGDITKIAVETIPSHDISCAGFPCQAFSIAGKKKGFEDTRGTLIYEILRIASYHQPKVLLLENVPNLLKHNRGETFQIICENLNKCGYDIFYKILNASDFELAQSRKRLYIICFRKDLKIDKFEFPKALEKTVVLKDIIDEKVDDRYYRYRTDYVFLDKVITNPRESCLAAKFRKAKQDQTVYSLDAVSSTLTTSHSPQVLVNNQVRYLTIKECARLQGFPEDFIFNISNTRAIEKLGNAVAVNVVKQIYKAILNVVDLKNPT